MQRRDAVDRSIGIGAPLQQEVGECDLPDDDRVGQRVRSVGSGLVHAGPRGEQDAGGLDVAVAGGGDQRRERLPRSGMDIGAPLDQRADDVPVAPGDRPHQRRLVGGGGGRVDVGPAGEQRPHDVEAAGARGCHQRRQAVRLRRVGIRPGGEEPPDHRHARVLARPGQRRHAVIVRGVHVGADAEEQIDRFAVVPVGRPEQRRRAIGPCGVHVELLAGEQPAQTGGVALCHRLHEAQVRFGGRRAAGRCREKDETQAGETLRQDAHSAPPAFGSVRISIGDAAHVGNLRFW